MGFIEVVDVEVGLPVVARVAADVLEMQVAAAPGQGRCGDGRSCGQGGVLPPYPSNCGTKGSWFVLGGFSFLLVSRCHEESLCIVMTV